MSLSVITAKTVPPITERNAPTGKVPYSVTMELASVSAETKIHVATKVERRSSLSGLKQRTESKLLQQSFAASPSSSY